jgi:hypothetical protein
LEAVWLAPSRRKGWIVTVERKFPKPVVRRVAHGTNTVNWGRILKLFLDQVGAGGSLNATLIDSGGVVRTGVFKSGVTRIGTITYILVGIGSSAVVDLGVLGRLGTGTTPASRTDFNLATPQGSFFSLASGYNDADVVTLTGTASFGSPISPTEAGLFIELGNTAIGGKARYMLDRSVFTALPPGTVFTATWTITLG